MITDLGYSIKRCVQGLEAAQRLIANAPNGNGRSQANKSRSYWEAQLRYARRRESGAAPEVPEAPSPVDRGVSPTEGRYPVVYDRVKGLMGIAAGPWRVLMQGATEEQVKRIAYLVNADKEFPW